MPKTLEFKLLQKFESLNDFNEYKLDLPDFTNTHTKYSQCSMCKRNDRHKMKIQYGKCTNELCYDETGLCPEVRECKYKGTHEEICQSND